MNIVCSNTQLCHMAVIPDNVKMLSCSAGTQTAPSLLPIGSFSNDDGDGIENIKKPEV